MPLTRFAVTRYLATVAIFLAVAVAGIASYTALPINQFPKVNIPVVTVVTTYPGANPQAVEIQVTQPVENVLAGLSNIDTLTSTSGEGFSSVVITFTDQADPTQISSAVQQQLSTIGGSLPAGASQPVAQKVDLSQVPVMELALVDDSLAPQDLYDVAHDTLLPPLQGLNGVSTVQLIGGRQDQITVAVNPTRLAGYGVSLSQVQAALAAANTSLPGGSITQRGSAFDLEVTGLVTRPADLAGIVVASSPSATPGGSSSQVRLRDIATVSAGASDQTQITRVNGQQAILIAIGQQNGFNLTDVTDGVNKALPQFKAFIPASSQLVVVQDNTPFVRASLLGIEEELVTAIFLTALVLLSFLHNARAAIIVLFSIPTTLLTTFLAMRLLGFSLNFLSTLALVLTIGILVDDSIVVLENILRHLERGAAPLRAALDGRAEIGLAALAITLVDVVVFAPTGLVSGTIGGFFREFGFTIAAATLTSLAVSFTLTPMLAARLLANRGEATHTSSLLGRFGRRWDRWFHALEERYRRLLGWSLRHRPIVLVAAGLSLGVGIGLVGSGRVATEFVPNADSGVFTVSTTEPPGTPLEAHDAAMQEIDQILLDMPDVQTVTASVGVSGQGILGSSSTGQARFGTATVQVRPLSSGRPPIDAIVADARQRLAQVPGITIQVTSSGGGGGGGSGHPVAVQIQGPDLSQLNILADQLEQELDATPGLVNVSNGASVGSPELLVQVDQARADELGVSTASLGTAVRTAFAGVTATKFQKPDGTLENVVLELASQARTDVGSLDTLPILTSSGQSVPLSSFATISQTSGPSQISRNNRQRLVTVGADLDTGVALGTVTPRVQAAIARLALPPGYTASAGGNLQQQSQSFGQLFQALAASVLLAYLLMAILYNSLIDPLVILFSLPVAFGGAMVGLWLFGYSFSIFAAIGLILLAALSIKNGILLVDRTNRNREAGMEKRAALLEAGPARLRAILMTSITIALSLFPTALKFGEGAELRAPLAATVLGGVVSSTLLTLVLVPVMYSYLDGLPTRLAHAAGRPFRRVRGRRASAAVADGRVDANGTVPSVGTPASGRPPSDDAVSVAAAAQRERERLGD